VPSLNLQPNIRGGTAKKITSSLYRKFVGATQKKKIKETTKSKTNRLASNTLLGLSERRKRRFCRNRTPADTLSDSDTDLAVLFDDDSTEEEQDADCVCCTGRFSEDHKGYDVRNISGGRTHFVPVWRKSLFVSLSGINTVSFLVCILCIHIFFFLNSVTILCAFCLNYSPPQIRNTCGPN